MKRINENNIQTDDCGQADVDFYIRKAHKLRSEMLGKYFSKRKKTVTKEPKFTMPQLSL